MTAHGAKGLEAPVVILPQTHRRTDDTSRDRLRWWDPEPAEDGAFNFDARPLPYWKPSEADRPHQTETLELVEKQRVMEEERRLLYVAMTRARSGSISPAGRPRSRAKTKTRPQARPLPRHGTIRSRKPSKPPTPRSASNG